MKAIFHKMSTAPAGVIRQSSVFLQVQRYWDIYSKKVDTLVQEALRTNIKNSMKKLSKAINGDNKTTPNPLFHVLVVLLEPSPHVTPKVLPTTVTCLSHWCPTARIHKCMCVCVCGRWTSRHCCPSWLRLLTSCHSSLNPSQGLNTCLRFKWAGLPRETPSTSTLVRNRSQ